jgi:formylglycine-generating enzyme required for sulfatase activity
VTVLGLGLVLGVLCGVATLVWAQTTPNKDRGGDLAFWEELAFWETIKDSEDPAEYEAYLATYPDGRFVRIAEIRIRTLKASTDRESVPAGSEASLEGAAQAGAEPAGSSPARAGGGEGEPAEAGGKERSEPGTRAAESFSDCPVCPLMVVVPGGDFVMGSDGDRADEKPRHRVSFRAPFAIGAHEVTIREWMACVDDGACRYAPEDVDDERLPIANVSWDDAVGYARWLTEKTGAEYRLPSEAEWEYAASGGTTTAFWWGDEAPEGRANCRGCGSEWEGKSPAPVGSFAPNPFGLYDVHGNVWEWTMDCANPSYEGAPSDGSAWLAGDCLARMLRGGSWNLGPDYMRTARRNHYDRDVRYYVHGLRVARGL